MQSMLNVRDVQCAVCSVQCAVCSVQCAVRKMCSAMYREDWGGRALQIGQQMGYHPGCEACSVQYVEQALCVRGNMQCAVCSL